MKKLFVILFILTVTLYPQSQFNVDFDYAVFEQNENQGIIELYYSFNQFGMKVIKKNDVDFVFGLLEINIDDLDADTTYLQKEYTFKSPLKNDNNQNLNGVLRFALKPGNYACTMIGKDFREPNNFDSTKFIFEIKSPQRDRFYLSDIELAANIIQHNTNPDSYFYKNTLEVIPNPNSLYGENLPVLYFYTEIYNIDKNVYSKYLKISHFIFDSSNRIRYKKQRFIVRKNSSIVEIGAINLKKFPSGSYTLVVVCSDTLKNIDIKSSKRFFVYNPAIIDTAKNVDYNEIFESELAEYNDEQLDEYFSICKYIATDSEISSWEKLVNIDAKRKFLLKFWKKRDSDRNTAVNEYKNIYMSRVEYANNSFGNLLQKKGWKTDRGRVYILYGKPSDIERHPNESDSRPYEIWYYDNIEGGVKFIFADFSDFNDYRLIYSDKLGEFADENWRQRIMR